MTSDPARSTAARADHPRARVVVDKPLALTVQEAEQLIEAADTAGRTLTVFQNRRWDGYLGSY